MRVGVRQLVEGIEIDPEAQQAFHHPFDDTEASRGQISGRGDGDNEDRRGSGTLLQHLDGDWLTIDDQCSAVAAVPNVHSVARAVAAPRR